MGHDKPQIQEMVNQQERDHYLGNGKQNNNIQRREKLQHEPFLLKTNSGYRVINSKENRIIKINCRSKTKKQLLMQNQVESNILVGGFQGSCIYPIDKEGALAKLKPEDSHDDNFPSNYSEITTTISPSKRFATR